MAAVIANEFTEAADDLYLNALIEIGLVLFVITLVINALSRLLIWSVERAVEAKVAAAEAGSRRGFGGRRVSRGARRRVVSDAFVVGSARRPVVARARPARAGPLLRHQAGASPRSNWAFFTQDAQAGRRGRAAAWPTRSWERSCLIGIASVLAVPVGVIAGRLPRPSTARTRFATARALRGRRAERRPVDRHRDLRLRRSRSCRSTGSRALAGGFALGVMMIPIITRTTEELLRLVPVDAARRRARARRDPRARGVRA